MSAIASVGLSDHEIGAAVVERLGGKEGALKFLRDEVIIQKISKTFPHWGTVVLGTGLKTKSDFQKALLENDCRINHYGEMLLASPGFSVSEVRTSVDLVMASVGDFGLNQGAYRADLFKRAEELELDLCPCEVGPQLCLQIVREPQKYSISVGMEPIVDGDNHPSVFHLEWNTNRPQLNSACCRYGRDFFEPYQRFIWKRRNK